MPPNLLTDTVPMDETWSRPGPEVVAAFDGLPAAAVGDVLDRLPVMDAGIRHLAGPTGLVGPALTVQTRPGDNLAIFRALQAARPGDVLVVAGGGDRNRALLGDLIGELLVAHGVTGVVIDGAVRDVATLDEMGLTVFARAVSPAGPFKNGPGRVGTAIACGGVVVGPGDLVVADGDGVVVAPAATLPVTLEAAWAKLRGEADLRRDIVAGRPVLDRLLNITTNPSRDPAQEDA